MDDEAAKLFAEHLVWAMRTGSYFARRWRRAHEVEDYTAVAMTSMWLAARTFDEARGVPFRAYATRLIRNSLVNHRQSGHRALQTVSLEDVVIDRRAHDPARQAEVRDLMEHVLSPLSDRQRAVVVARCEGWTFAEIGHEFGETKQAASLTFEVALCRMRGRLLSIEKRDS